MLTENDISEAVANHLVTLGWTIRQRLATTEAGVDIIADRPDVVGRLLIEAKGETSSKGHTRRFGKPFTANQAGKHVAVAIYWALKSRSQYPQDAIGLAFPEDKNHVRYIEPVIATLLVLGIRVFLVGSDKSVRIFGTPL